ncbi:MAG: DUF4249 domain-containing protein [Cyclobacteriaceae bacterium]|nr:DUF4249 domain-containing protein [Cyclobacteriaceae bacterium]
MKFSKHILNLFYLVLLFSNCVKEFDPPSQGYENLLVVEAFLSDGDEAFQMKLSRSIPIDTSAFIPEPGASVSLSEDSGEKYILVESNDPGIYFYPGNLNAQIGKSYQIHIQTRNGNQYESSHVTMRETPEIDSVTFRFEERPSAGLKGVQIFVTTHDPGNDTWYYRWEWDETWIFYTPYLSEHIYEDDQIFIRTDNINTCWKKAKSTSIEFSTSKNLSEDIIHDYPLRYVSTETDRLKSKYSINVRQYALSEESYNYWKELQKVTENLGTLFDPQPSIVMGNIYNVNDDKEIVLGYFDASTVKEQRLFIRRSDIPRTGIPNYYSFCTDSLVRFNRIQEMLDNGYFLASEILNDFGGLEYQFSTRFCIDCTLVGTNVRPDFWE